MGTRPVCTEAIYNAYPGSPTAVQACPNNRPSRTRSVSASSHYPSPSPSRIQTVLLESRPKGENKDATQQSLPGESDHIAAANPACRLLLSPLLPSSQSQNTDPPPPPHRLAGRVPHVVLGDGQLALGVPADAAGEHGEGHRPLVLEHVLTRVA